MLFSKDEIYSRIERFQKFLQEKSIDLAIIHHNADMFYFSGTVGNGYLIIPAMGDPVFAVKRGVERIKALSPISNIVLFKKSNELKEIVLKAKATTFRILGLAMDVITSSELSFLTTRICNNVDVEDVSTAIRMQRACKSASELSLMKKAAEIGDYVFSEAKNYIESGINEWNLYAYLEYKARLKGSLGIVRVRNPHLEIVFGHVLSGPEGAEPSYGDSPTGGKGPSPAFAQGSSYRTISEGEMISIDTMLCYDGYLSDQTRNFTIGKPPRILLEAYEMSLKLHDLFVEHAKPGIRAGELYEIILNEAKKSKLFEFFMGAGNNKVTFLGHGIGIEVDEFPFIAPRQQTILQEGMTIAFEPKFIIPGHGVAGIENTYVIAGDGAKALNKFPQDLTIL